MKSLRTKFSSTQISSIYSILLWFNQIKFGPKKHSHVGQVREHNIAIMYIFAYIHGFGFM
jgi:hypothetical protein